MSLLTKVKISSITNLSDARYCAGMGVQYLGFNFFKGHESYIAPDIYREITSWVSGPEFIGEFEGADPAYIHELLAGLDIDCIEVTRPENLQELSLSGKPVILKADLSQYASLSDLESDLKFAINLVSFFLITNSGQSVIQLADIYALGRQYPILLGYGIDSSGIRELIKQTGIQGIAVQGGSEEKVGFKDYERLADILEALEEEE